MGVHLEPVTMPFLNAGRIVNLRDMAAFGECGLIGTQPHGAAQIAALAALLQAFFAHPFGDHADDRLIGRPKFGGRRPSLAGQIAHPFDAGHLHAEAYAEERHLLLAGEADRTDLALAAALAKTAGHEDAVHRLQLGRQIIRILLEQLGIEPFHMHAHAVGHAAMHQRFGKRLIGIRQADIFADDTDGHFAFRVLIAIENIVPARQVWLGRMIQPEGTQHLGIQTLGMIVERHRIDALGVQRRNDRFLADVAELRDLAPLAVRQRTFAAAQQQIGLNAQACQFAHAVLRRFGLQLACGGNERHQRYMDGNRLLRLQLVAQLTDRLDERQRLDIAHRAADFAQHEVQPLGIRQREFLDGIGHMRDDLHRGAQIIAAPFLGDNVPVHAARGDIVALMCRDAGEALIMAKIQIGLGPVIGDVDLSVLIRAHRARIDIQIGIEFANADGVATRLEKGGERCRHKTFSERGDHAAGYENVPRHGRRALSGATPVCPAPHGLYPRIICRAERHCRPQRPVRARHRWRREALQPERDRPVPYRRPVRRRSAARRLRSVQVHGAGSWSRCPPVRSDRRPRRPARSKGKRRRSPG